MIKRLSFLQPLVLSFEVQRPLQHPSLWRYFASRILLFVTFPLVLTIPASGQNELPEKSEERMMSQALHQAIEQKDSRKEIRLNYQLGGLYSERREDKLAAEYLNKGLDKALDLNDQKLTAEGYLQLAHHYGKTNEPRKSIGLLNKSLPVFLNNDLKSLSARSYHLLGANYLQLSLYESALSYYLKSLAVNEEIKDEREIAEDFSSVGKVYQRTGDFEDAVNYFSKALDINTTIKNSKGRMDNLLNIGVIHQKRGEFKQALAYYKKVLPIAKGLDERRVEAVSTGNIGSTLMQQGELEQGLVFLQEALALKEKYKLDRSILHTLNDIADVKIQLKDAEGAKEAAEKVIRLAKQYEEGNQLRYGYLNLSRTYKQVGDFENAYYYLEKYDVVKDSLFGIEKAQQINELQIEYETEKKDQAIASFEREKEIEAFRKRAYFTLAGILLIVGALLYYNQRLKTKKQKELLRKEKEVDRLKSNFFANISHEFRTPLTLILGPIETMLSQKPGSAQQLQLNFMKDNASRLLRLINQILDLSKVESGFLSFTPKEANIIETVKGVGSTFTSLADSRDIRLSLDCSYSELLVSFDQSHLETILINLITNAFKFSAVGGHICIKLQVLSQPGTKKEHGELEITITDEGEGISEEQVTHIFDRFYQAGHAKKSSFGGTGIGLALTKELVELHGGTIAVSSQLGTGTKVTVRLPMTNIVPEESQSVGKPSLITHFSSANDTEKLAAELIDLPQGKAALAGQKPLLLIVEDNEDVRNYIKTILDPDYSLIEAVNGEEGIRQAKAHIPDLIISDVMMPKMNGYEVCKKLKQDEKTAHIPIILLTAKASVHSRVEGLETEADLYLCKPFVPKELQLCIHNLIKSREQLRERYNKKVVLKPSEVAINSVDELFLERLLKVVEANYQDELFSVDQLSKELSMSRSQLHRKLQSLTNESTSQFIRSFRLQRAMEYLKKNNATISEIAYKVGFASPSYFNRCFLKHYGTTPSSIIEAIS